MHRGENPKLPLQRGKLTGGANEVSYPSLHPQNRSKDDRFDAILMNDSDLYQLLPPALRAALAAGEAIMQVYARDFDVDYKADESPLTDADRAAHRIIVAELEPTGIPVLSEESAAIPYRERKSWPAMWLVDPLDGTKEFVKRNGDFTVNIALIVDQQPALGVVYAPALGDIYIGGQGLGAYRASASADYQRLEKALKKFPTIGNPFEALADRPVSTSPLRVVASRSHSSPETESFIERLRARGHEVESGSRGSALKICQVATGEALIYPRLGPTMEWDTAAAQAVVEAMGGRVVVYDEAAHEAYEREGLAPLFECAALRYNRSELLNPWFVVMHPESRSL